MVASAGAGGSISVRGTAHAAAGGEGRRLRLRLGALRPGDWFGPVAKGTRLAGWGPCRRVIGRAVSFGQVMSRAEP
eukprot:8602301-Pyramimonas_sp.AAC.1